MYSHTSPEFFAVLEIMEYSIAARAFVITFDDDFSGMNLSMASATRTDAIMLAVFASFRCWDDPMHV